MIADATNTVVLVTKTFSRKIATRLYSNIISRWEMQLNFFPNIIPNLADEVSFFAPLICYS